MDNNIFKKTIPFVIKIEIEAVDTTGKSVKPEAIMAAQNATQVPASERDILALAKSTFLQMDGVTDVRLGYKFKNGWITKERAIVIKVTSRKSISELKKINVSPFPTNFLGYPIDLTTPTIIELIEQAEELKPQSRFVEPESRYFPPEDVQLDRIENEDMQVIASVSPEEGWNTLREFFKDAEKTLTIAIYDFGAEHILETINQRNDENFEQFNLTIQPGQSVGQGTKKFDWKDEDVVASLRDTFKEKFKMAWVHIGSVNGWVHSSYHIKVAVKDTAEIHLSSGNYQSSNQPKIEDLENDSAAYLLKTYNREWHTVVKFPPLATVFEKFILHDLKNNRANGREAVVNKQDLYLLMPKNVEVEAEASEKRKFSPFNETRKFTLTPILSPDNYFDEVLKLVESAESELFIQNQTFNAPEENTPLEQLMAAVLRKQQAGIDVKIIFRSMFAATTRENLEYLIEFGFDPLTFRVHSNMHTKGIIVDSNKVLIGSQNWSNAGVSVNRDASLLFEDNLLANYFREIFLHDWHRVAKPFIGREIGGISIVGREAQVPANMQKIPLGDILEML